MNKKVQDLLEEGQRILREQEAVQKRKEEEKSAERERKVAQAKKEIMKAVCGKLPEELWPYLHLPEFDGYFFPYDCDVKLVIQEFQLISLRVRYHDPDVQISGKWIIVAGIRYSPPQITNDDEVWEGEISFPTAASEERHYGLIDARPYATDEITIALAIAKDRYDQFMELEIARKNAVETLKAQVEKQRRKRMDDQQKLQEQIIPPEQIDGIQMQVGQINPLVVIEGWIREIVQDEVARNGAAQ